ncbi:hypothetical protein DLAC_01356 [Tieghemostelium lacteum]|uniref:EGF-like domain-containing protein n=1 Tax=Tieghemostelium lacteum TaxID=361077 RepID=A0A152A8E7_TIELA|nr:hypothetical protein DLAC_01356 [Tieghemostelium lacteum]|eukprot:KYR02510.1 hypothetical protein DLAC_01356 [Tieghemostelium lacteum]
MKVSYLLIVIIALISSVNASNDMFYNFTLQKFVEASTQTEVLFQFGQDSLFSLCFIGTANGENKIYFLKLDKLTTTVGDIQLYNYTAINNQNFPTVSNITVQAIYPTSSGCLVTTASNIITTIYDGANPIVNAQAYPQSYITEIPNQVLACSVGSFASYIAFTAIDGNNDVVLLLVDFSGSLALKRYLSFLSPSPVVFSTFDLTSFKLVITTADGTVRTISTDSFYTQNNPNLVQSELPSGYTTRNTFLGKSDRVFSCLQSTNGGWALETLGGNINPITFNNTNGPPYKFNRCLSGYFDYNQNQFIIMVNNNDNGNLDFLYLSPLNSEPTIAGSFPYTISIANPNTKTSIYYPAFGPSSYSPLVFVGISSSSQPNGIVSFSYSSLCPEDCNGFLSGTCVTQSASPYYVCDCNDYFSGETCASSLAYLSETIYYNVSFYDVTQTGGSRITLYGNPFSNTSDYLYQINDEICENIVFVDKESITCHIEYTQSIDPFGSVGWYTEFSTDGQSRSGDITNFWGITQITHIYQTNYLVFDTKYAVPLKYLEFSWAGNSLTCDIISNNTQYSCPLLPTQVSGTLIIHNNFTAKDIFNGELSVTPYISGYLPTTPIPTLSSTITIQGQYFSDLVPQHTSINVGGESLTYSTVAEGLVVVLPDGIKLDNSVSIYINGTKISNSIPLVYQTPQVDSNYTQGAVPNVFTISGVNFGYEESLVEISVTPSHHPLDIYSATVQTVEQSKIVFSIPDTAQYGELTVTVDDADSNKLEFALPPFISEISPLPNIDGSDIITIKGRYLFGTTISTSIGNGDDLDCSFSNGSNYQSFAYCQSIAGTGTFSINVACEVGNVIKSHQFESNFHAPTIDQVTPTSYKKGINTTFTITGSNFANVGLYVTINGENCTVTGNEFPESFLCNLIPQSDPTTVTNPVKISVTVDGIQGHNSIINYEKPCPDNCSNHGSCDLIAGKCTCEAEYTSDNCSQLKDTSSEDLSNSPFLTYSTFITLLSFVINIIF